MELYYIKKNLIKGLKPFLPLLIVTFILIGCAIADRNLYKKGEYDGYDNLNCRTFVDFNLDMLIESKAVRVKVTDKVIIVEDGKGASESYLFFIPYAASTNERESRGVAMFVNYLYVGDYLGDWFFEDYCRKLETVYESYEQYDYKKLNDVYCNRYIAYNH